MGNKIEKCQTEAEWWKEQTKKRWKDEAEWWKDKAKKEEEKKC